MLVVRDLGVRPPGPASEWVVRGFSLDVRSGQWVGITGPNGSGKSLLAMVLSGLWPPSAGTVHLNGRPIHPSARDQLKGDLAVVLQDPTSQLLQETVADELRMTARNLDRNDGQTDARASWLVDRLGFSNAVHRDPRTLSAGWQQVVLIGAALVAQPKLLIVDEGGAHLDADVRRQVLECIREQVDAGLSVIWFSQADEELAAADQVIVLPTQREDDMNPLRVRTGGLPELSSECLLTLSIAPYAKQSGPCVRTDHPIRVVIGERGVTGLTGPNGYGKTVILETVGGALELAQIRTEWTGNHRLGPLICGQFPDLQIFSEKVADEAVHAATARGLPRQVALARAGEALGRLGMPEEFLDRRTWELSSGQKRILEAVAALLAPASLVILDEPTCGLDQRARRGLQALIQERCTESAVLIASQDLEWLEGLHAKLVTIGAPASGNIAKSQ